MSTWFPPSSLDVEKSRFQSGGWRTLRELDDTEGTVQLRDSSTIAEEHEPSAVILVPQPSLTDANDPLRWPRWKKHVAFLSICTLAFLTNFAIGGFAPAFYILSQQFHKTETQTSTLLVWPIFVMGLFNFFWVPMANYFGKRPVFVVASGTLCGAYVWGALATSFGSLFWSSMLAAFAGSSTEALAASMVNDLFFLHERGAKMGLYMNFIAGGNTLGPLVCGFVITGLSWRWHKWLAVMLTGINFIIMVLFVPETRYRRGKAEKAYGQSDLATDSDYTTDSVSSLELLPRPVFSSLLSEDDLDSILSGQGSSATMRSSSEVPCVRRSLPPPYYPSPTATPDLDRSKEKPLPSPAFIPKKAWAEELSMWSGTPPDTKLFRMFIRPLPMFVYPCVTYAFLCYAVSLVVTVSVNILNPFVLQAEPYNWSPMVNGLINIPGFIGNILGGYAGGWLVDVFCDRRARRRDDGMFEPESRLWLLVFPILITAGGCVLFGYGVEETLPWISLFFGFGMVSFALTAVPTITMSYVSDCLLPINADALVLVNGKLMSECPPSVRCVAKLRSP